MSEPVTVSTTGAFSIDVEPVMPGRVALTIITRYGDSLRAVLNEHQMHALTSALRDAIGANAGEDYPGAAELRAQRERWAAAMKEAEKAADLAQCTPAADSAAAWAAVSRAWVAVATELREALR